MASFNDLGLSEATLRILETRGFEVPTPIQEKTIPAILSGSKDVVGQAQTGTGKTAAFGLPMLELLKSHRSWVQALILVPTRELAIQVAEEINSLKGDKDLRVVPIYGGQSIDLQLRRLDKGVDIVVGTPGRVIDHLERRTLKLDRISFLVLDEADEMLDMGFFEDVETIMATTASEKRTMLFSATMPREILQAAEKYMREYALFKVTQEKLTASSTDQIYFEVREEDKFEALCRIVDMEDEFYGLVFCRTRLDVDDVSHHLIERGYDADALHGDMSQSLREKILDKFRRGIINILVATDVAARGIDVKDLTHVINFALPNDPKAYVHRVGRTGRAGKEGSAITFITPSEYRKLRFIMQATRTDIRKVKMPKVTEIIEAKKRRIRAELEDAVESLPRQEYLAMAGELLENSDPAEVLAALLQQTYGDVLDAKNYAPIADAAVDNKGKTRLFVTHGRKNGMTPDKLAAFIKKTCGVGNIRSRDIQIYDAFSFINLPFAEAEAVLAHFKKHRKGSGPVIKKARDRSERK